MAQQRIGFEWLIGDESFATLHRSPLEVRDAAGSLLLVTGEQRFLTRTLRVAALLFVLIAAAGSAFTQRELAIAQAHAGIELSLQREHLAWQTQDRDLFAELVAPEVETYWEREWRAYWQLDGTDPSVYQVELLDVASLEAESRPLFERTGYDAASPTLVRADVQILQREAEWWESFPYQETRFYRRVGQKWLRTMPPPTYWGPAQTLHTEHLRLTFSARDADIVHASAEKLDRAVASLYELLELAPPVGDNALAIEILPDRVRGLDWTAEGFQVISPRLEIIPAAQPMSDYLARSIFYLATYQALREATPTYSGQFFYYRWSVLIAGIRSWLREEMVGGASPWRDQAVELFRAENRTRDFIDVDDITLFAEDAHSDDRELIWRYIAAESLVDYIVQEYGEAQLRRVFGALGEVGNWKRLVHNVFPVTWQEFEAGWNRYLVENHELGVDR